MPKASQAEALYSPRSRNSLQTCGLCSMFTRFNRTDGECSKTEGVVATEGWCSYFERKEETTGDPGAAVKFAKVKQI